MIKKIQVTIPAQTFQIDVEIDGVTPPVDPPPPPVQTGFKVGSNGFPWSPMRLFTDAGLDWIRCYFASGWAWRPKGLHIQPMWQASTPEAWGMDEYLQKAKDAGKNVLWTNHQTPEWYRNTGRTDGNNDFAPIPAGTKRDDPKSFKDYASYLFQIAARYGSVKYPDSVLQVDPESRWNGDLTEKKSGLNLLKYMECFNEEKWWLKGTEGYIEPETMAAMMSACYDGHENTLGENVGIKTADSSIIVVMPGLTDFDMNYILAMEIWFKTNRKDKKWGCDIANLHHYSNTGNKKGEHPAQWVASGGCPPIEDKNFDSVKTFVDYFSGKGLKLWITEFGYDTKAPSQMHIVGRNGKSDEQAQSLALIETVKKYKEYGVDAVFIFNIHDDLGAADGGQFETSGIYSSQATGFKPKPAVSALKAYLTPPASKAVGIAVANPSTKNANFKRPLKIK